MIALEQITRANVNNGVLIISIVSVQVVISMIA